MSSAALTSSRPRSSRSCARCVRRKVRCDQKRPTCTRCAKGIVECSYQSAGSQTNRRITFIDETSSVIANFETLQGRVNRLDDMLTDIVQRESNSCEGAEVNGNEGQDIDGDVGHLYRGPQGKSRYVAPDFFAMISLEVTEINHLLQQQHQNKLEPELYSWPEEQNNSLPNSAHHSSSSSTDRPEFHSKSQTGHLCGDIFPYPPEWSSDDNLVRSTTRINSARPAILDDLPSKEQCEVLIWTYLRGYHTISPLFYGPSFLRQARLYFERDELSSGDLNLQFLALLMAVLFAGSAICSRKRLSELFDGLSREELSSSLYRRAVKAIRLTNFPQTPSLYTLSAFIIVDTLWLREEQPLTCCSFVGLATRVAQMLGLHKDPSSFADISPIESQVRRQLWWSLVAVDAQVSLASGLPPIIDCNTCQVHDSSEMPEDLFEVDIPAQNQRKSIMGLFVGGKVEFYKNANKILQVIHSHRFTHRDLDYILQIIQSNKADLTLRQQQISEIEATLPLPRRFVNDNDEMVSLQDSQSNSVLARFAKAALLLFTVKPYAIIQGPVRRHNMNSYLLEKDPDAILGCKKYLHGFLKITQTCEFQPWHWRWPGQHQPLQSIMTLILHLEQFPDDPTTKETRQLIDLTIFMCGPQENHGILSSEDGNFDPRPLSLGGSKAWDFIRRARANVWTKSGLDPIILDCPERADDICIGGVKVSDEPAFQIIEQVEDPFHSLGAWPRGGDDLFHLGVYSDFTFDASLPFSSTSES